jgi:CPA2 family monovalent cation:H+ antiporter-2
MEGQLNLIPVALLLIGAAVGGLLMAGLRQPPMVGYIVAGAVFGPSGFGLISDRPTIHMLAELGVLILLFVIGMHLSLRAFKNIYRTALGAASVQIIASVALMLTLAHLFGWNPERAILYGFVLALSSTAVGIKILEEIGELRNETGRCAVGVLIAQDLAVVPMLIIVVGMAGEEGIDVTDLTLKLAIAVAALAALIWWLSRRHRIHLPFRPLLVRYADLVPIAAVTLCVLGAAVSGALGLSAGLGAFLAGLYVGNSTERALLVRATEPVQSLLLMVFFVSIGLLVDLAFVSEHLGMVLLLVAIVFVLNSGINVLALRIVGESWRVAFIAGFALAQVGEFAFILTKTGVQVQLIGEEAERVVVAVIAISMVASPLWLELARRLHALRSAPSGELSSLWGRLLRDEARLLRLRSGRLVQGSSQLAASLGGALRRDPVAEPPAEKKTDVGEGVVQREGERP